MNNLLISLNDLVEIKNNLHILNINELKIICKKFLIPFNIFIIKNKIELKTNEVDHKEIICNNIIYYLENNKIPQKTLYNEKNNKL